MAPNSELSNVVNQSNDTPLVHNPLEKLFNKYQTSGRFLNTTSGVSNQLDHFRGSEGSQLVDSYLRRDSVRAQRKMLSSPDQQVLAPEQSPRQFATQADNLTRFNLLQPNSSTTVPEVGSLLNEVRNSGVDSTHWTKLALTKVFFEAPYSPILSNNINYNSQNYDASNQTLRQLSLVNRNWELVTRQEKSDDIHLLRGKRDGAPKFLSTAY
jgi:hypothetical protein